MSGIGCQPSQVQGELADPDDLTVGGRSAPVMPRALPAVSSASTRNPAPPCRFSGPHPGPFRPRNLGEAHLTFSLEAAEGTCTGLLYGSGPPPRQWCT